MEHQLIETLKKKRVFNLNENSCYACDNIKHIAICFKGDLPQ